MVRNSWWLAAVVALGVGLAGPVHAETIAFFDNDTYTDPPGESANLTASLMTLGHTVTPFSGIAAADWQAATAAADLLVIPELDNASLFPDLDAPAQAAIFEYVMGGGSLLMFDRNTRTTELLNGVFGFALVAGTGGASTLNAGATVDTAFEGGPAALPGANATEGIETASLPPYTVNAYTEVGGDSVLFVSQVGKGRIGYLGFDWFEVPTPAEWEQVLGLAIDEITVEPAPLDAFQCYKAKDLKSPKFVAQKGVGVDDQFGSASIDVKKPFMVCAPASVNGGAVENEDAHVCCYKSKGPKLSPAESVETTDAFGTLQLRLSKSKTFCTPCTKALLP